MVLWSLDDISKVYTVTQWSASPASASLIMSIISPVSMTVTLKIKQKTDSSSEPSDWRVSPTGCK